MTGDKFRREMAALSPCETFHARAVVRTDEGLVLNGSFNPNADEYLVLSGYQYWFMYRPRNDQPKYQGKPYILSSPHGVLIRTRYADWDDFCSECEREPRLMWIKNWSELDEDFFAMAKRNIGLQLGVPFKLKEYEKHLQELYREQFGEEPGDTALLCAPYEGEASAAANEEYKKQLYEDNIKRKVSQEKERRAKK